MSQPIKLRSGFAPQMDQEVVPQIRQSVEESMHTQKTMDRLLQIATGNGGNSTKEE